MVDLNKRIGLISEIVNEKPGIGKTAMMKFVFLLQRVYKVPLGYNFEIYTYGPYSAEVMEDIDYAKQENAISIKRELYENGYSGYSLNPSSKTDYIVHQENAFISEYKDSINKVVETFGDKTAKDLELMTTIVYLYSNYIANQWPTNEIPANVHDIKPHFDINTIEREYRHLEDLGILKLAV